MARRTFAGLLVIAASQLCLTLPTVGLATADPSSIRLTSVDASDGQPPCNVTGGFNCPTESGDGYVYVYDPATRIFVKVTNVASGDLRIEYTYAATPDCPLASPTQDVNCAAAATYCTSAGQAGVHETIWRRELSPSAGPWQRSGDVCTGNAAITPLDQALGALSEYERDHMPVPRPAVQPGGVALVNLPVIVSVPDAGPQVMDVQQPVPGQLVATPTYEWTFDDGTVLTGAGRSFDGTDPRANPTHYLAHTYAAADAHASVTLTVTWNATFAVAGQVFPLPPLSMPPLTTTFTVQEARGVLVSS